MPVGAAGLFEQATAALAEAVRLLGGQAKTARLLGVAQPSVWRWVRTSRPLPGEHVLKVEKALRDLGITNITCHDLRPDLYPREAASPVDLEPAR